jgi:hypothetical protein
VRAVSRRVRAGSGGARALVARVHRLARAARLAGVRAPDRVARLGLRAGVLRGVAQRRLVPADARRSGFGAPARVAALARGVEDQERHERGHEQQDDDQWDDERHGVALPMPVRDQTAPPEAGFMRSARGEASRRTTREETHMAGKLDGKTIASSRRRASSRWS